MYFWVALLFISIFIICYNYAGYAVIAMALNKLKKRGPAAAFPAGDSLPSVSFIVAAYNEEDCIREKILNSLDQDYPAGKVEWLFITDGSTDNTAGIIGEYPSIQLLHDPRRGGKSAALNRAVQHASHDILIFSDANTVLNKLAIKHIARHYADPQTGGVAGEKKVLAAAGADEVGAGEGLYWKYESFLKKIDSECYSVVGAAGELFSVKKELFERLDDNIILDDFVVSLKVAQKGRRVIYEPDAFATELPSFSLHDESKRKVRIAAGGFQAMWLLRGLLCFWRHPRLSFLYISHRVLRWTLTPLCLILALIANTVLVYTTDHWFYQLLLIGQALFYGGALAAKFSPSLGARFKPFKLCYYFVFMNVSVIQGFFRFLGRRQSGVWEKARRQQAGA